MLRLDRGNVHRWHHRLGLGRGKAAAEILKLYVDHLGKIFPSAPDAKGLASIWRRSARIGRDVRWVRYSPRALTEHLEQTFGDDVYGESERRLVIPTFDAQARLLVGADRICRLDLPNQVHPMLDDFRAAMELLPREGERLFQENRQQLATFFDGPRPPYQAHYGPRAAVP